MIYQSVLENENIATIISWLKGKNIKKIFLIHTETVRGVKLNEIKNLVQNLHMMTMTKLIDIVKKQEQGGLLQLGI